MKITCDMLTERVRPTSWNVLGAILMEQVNNEHLVDNNKKKLSKKLLSEHVNLIALELLFKTFPVEVLTIHYDEWNKEVKVTKKTRNRSLITNFVLQAFCKHLEENNIKLKEKKETVERECSWLTPVQHLHLKVSEPDIQEVLANYKKTGLTAMDKISQSLRPRQSNAMWLHESSFKIPLKSYM